MQNIKNIFPIHDSVDLGLTSGNLWSTCNLGARSAYEVGCYFAWGETTPMETCINSKYKYSIDGKIVKYCIRKEEGDVDNKILLDRDDDASTIIWGDKWKTQREFLRIYDLFGK